MIAILAITRVILVSGGWKNIDENINQTIETLEQEAEQKNHQLFIKDIKYTHSAGATDKALIIYELK